MKNKVEKMRDFYHSQITKSIDFRRKELLRLKMALKRMEDELLDAVVKDVGKPRFECYETELGILYREIDEMVKNLPKWSKPHHVATPLMLQPACCFEQLEPKGVVCVIAPWNYPLQLSIAPLIASMAAGNCTLIKMSRQSNETAKVLIRLFHAYFDEDYIDCILGDDRVNQEILEVAFDHMFFTGSVAVGKQIMEACSRFLTPVTLELGGKSPCIVDETADLKKAAEWIVWGKCLNGGQTCVGVDHLWVKEEIKERLIGELIRAFERFYPKGVSDKQITPIINDRQFMRLVSLMQRGRIIYGGQVCVEERKIAMTLIDQVDFEDAIMQEEIFGPLLPIMTYQNEAELLAKLSTQPKPLACYLFTLDQSFAQRFLKQFSFGGGCVNATILHLSNSRLGFGGIGQSGIGSYHGRVGFEALSHRKSILVRSSLLHLRFQFPPYRGKLPLIRWLMK